MVPSVGLVARVLGAVAPVVFFWVWLVAMISFEDLVAFDGLVVVVVVVCCPSVVLVYGEPPGSFHVLVS